MFLPRFLLLNSAQIQHPEKQGRAYKLTKRKTVSSNTVVTYIQMEGEADTGYLNSVHR